MEAVLAPPRSTTCSTWRRRTVVGSIGPITSAALQRHGVEPDLQPEHPKIGHLVAEIARQAGALLERKRVRFTG
jgi:uroporphyrinogen-III synthase